MLEVLNVAIAERFMNIIDGGTREEPDFYSFDSDSRRSTLVPIHITVVVMINSLKGTVDAR